MKKFDKPLNLNGKELLDELNAAGVVITEPPFIDGAGDFFLSVAEADKTKAAQIVATHNGTIIAPEPTIQQKLASVGLNLNDLKIALGL